MAEEKQTESAPVAAHTRKKRSSDLDEVLPEGVPIEVVEHRLPEEARTCEACGTVMTEIGTEVRRTLVLIPAQAKIREDVYYTYACQKCKAEALETPVVKTEKQPAVIPGSYAAPEAIAHIMVQKFCDGVSSVPAGAGAEPQRYKALPADHVQLDTTGIR